MALADRLRQGLRGGRIQSFCRRLTATSTQADVLAAIDEFNQDPAFHGILVRLPLPAGIDSDQVLAAAAPSKDVDGFGPDQRFLKDEMRVSIPLTQVQRRSREAGQIGEVRMPFRGVLKSLA
jgi:5,10-methylene-tetrahydrofolate dehydrogenase/methenyl tetrahydrofolate cyclohydrolase